METRGLRYERKQELCRYCFQNVGRSPTYSYSDKGMRDVGHQRRPGSARCCFEISGGARSTFTAIRECRISGMNIDRVLPEHCLERRPEPDLLLSQFRFF